MKTFNFIIILVSLLALSLIEFVSCQEAPPAPAPAPEAPPAPAPAAPAVPAAPAGPKVVSTTIGTITTEPDLSAVPAKLLAPKGNTFSFLLYASGNQKYQCIANPKQWLKNDTDVDLINDKNDGRQTFDPAFEIVHHYTIKTPIEGGNYTWDSLLPGDVSQVVGKIQESADAPLPETNLPWELTVATSRKEGGRLSNVSYILRINTSGGSPPPLDQCGVQFLDGYVHPAPFQADYLFYNGPLVGTPSTNQPSQPEQPAPSPSTSSKTNDGYSTKPIGPGKLSWVAIVGFISVGVISF